MAISVERHYEGREGTWELQKFKRDYVVTYVVAIDDPDTDHLPAVLGNVEIPDLGEAHPDDALSIVVSKNASFTDDNRKMLVRVNYSSDLGDMDPEEQQQSPLDRAPSWKFGFVKTTAVITEDIDGEAVVNSAEMAYPDVEVDRSYPTIQLTVNRATLDYAHILDLQDGLNDDTWQGFEAGAVRCMGIDVTGPKQENNITYFEYVYNFQINWTGWSLKLLDKGRHQRVSGELRAITDRYGREVTEDQLLDGSGAVLASGGDPVWNTFNVYRSVSFTGIP